MLAPLGGLSKAQGSAVQDAAPMLAIGGAGRGAASGAVNGAASSMEPPFPHPLSCLLQEACGGAAGGLLPCP